VGETAAREATLKSGDLCRWSFVIIATAGLASKFKSMPAEKHQGRACNRTLVDMNTRARWSSTPSVGTTAAAELRRLQAYYYMAQYADHGLEVPPPKPSGRQISKKPSPLG